MKKKLVILCTVLSLGTLAGCNINVNLPFLAKETKEEKIEEIVEKKEESKSKKDTKKKDSKKVVQSALSKEIQKLCENDIIKEIMGDEITQESFREILQKESSKLTEEQIEEFTKQYPGISLDESNFKDEISTYNWFADMLVITVKKEIDDGNITQETIDQLGMLTMFGVDVPDVTIEKNMDKKEIEEKILVPCVQACQTLLNKKLLKTFGVDIDDPETLEQLRNSFKDGWKSALEGKTNKDSLNIMNFNSKDSKDNKSSSKSSSNSKDSFGKDNNPFNENTVYDKVRINQYMSQFKNSDVGLIYDNQTLSWEVNNISELDETEAYMFAGIDSVFDDIYPIFYSVGKLEEVMKSNSNSSNDNSNNSSNKLSINIEDIKDGMPDWIVDTFTKQQGITKHGIKVGTIFETKDLIEVSEYAGVYFYTVLENEIDVPSVSKYTTVKELKELEKYQYYAVVKVADEPYDDQFTIWGFNLK